MTRPVREDDLKMGQHERNFHRDLLAKHDQARDAERHERLQLVPLELRTEKAAEQAWREQSAQWTSPHRMPQCNSNCNQGRQCDCQMACTAGDDPLPWWSPNGLIGGAIVLGLIAIVLWTLAYPPRFF